MKRLAEMLVAWFLVFTAVMCSIDKTGSARPLWAFIIPAALSYYGGRYE